MYEVLVLVLRLNFVSTGVGHGIHEDIPAHSITFFSLFFRDQSTKPTRRVIMMPKNDYVIPSL